MEMIRLNSSFQEKRLRLKTFADLKFENHPNKSTVHGTFDKQAKLFFNNGYGVSVITGGSGVYSDSEYPFEMAVLKGHADDWTLCYNTKVTDDVIGYLNEQNVTEKMKEVQLLEKDRDNV